MSAYEVRDELHLWWLGKPKAPTLIGTLRLVRGIQGVSLQYSPAWIQAGFPLSEDLPLIGQEIAPAQRETAVGAVDDARPDRWGERVIRFIDKPPRLSILEYLYFTGDERFGALGVSTSAERYEPAPSEPLPRLADVEAIHEVVRKLLANEPVAEEHRHLILPGGTLGGARPKALVEMDGRQWVVKFSEPGDDLDIPLLEHACMRLAEKAGIETAATQAIKLHKGHAVAVKRFDRRGAGNNIERLHAQTAYVALRAEGSDQGYPELAQLLRRRGVVDGGVARMQMRELFRRMVFNIFMDNTDDHEKNHALLMTDDLHLVLAPAYDVVPTAQGLGYQQLRVGKDAADSTIANALSESPQFGLSPAEAREEAVRVAKAVGGWKDHFRRAGASPHDIERLARFIDRDDLMSQRKALLARGSRPAARASRKP
jgi:serine/threonine-protein kinase HipA